MAVHSAFAKNKNLYACGYNSKPDFGIELTSKEFAKKSAILTDVYGSETQRFLNLLPSTAFEGFTSLSLKEVESLYAYFAEDKALKKSDLDVYRWLYPFLKTRRLQPRPF